MEAKQDLARIVSKENVDADEEVLEAYSMDESFAQSVRPSCVVKVKNAEEVRKIVAWANQSGTPLIPVSSGAPHFRGDTVPSLGGSVIVDLSEMKKIIRIDRRNRLAMIEPGVTFAELQPQLAKEGLRLPMPLLPRKSKSVVGSFLEREPHPIPKYHWDMTDPSLCMEVVWGNGETLMTGEAGGLGPLEQQWKLGLVQKWPLGPLQLDFHRLVLGAQGTMGIVTWMTVRCELKPAVEKLYFFPAERLDQLLDFTHRLVKFRYGSELFLMNRADLACLVGNGKDEIQGHKQEMPPWVLVVNMTGLEEFFPEERVEFEERDIKSMAQQYGLTPESSVGRVSDRRMQDVLKAASGDIYWKQRYKGSYADILFLTPLKKTPEFIGEAYRLAERYGYPSTDVGIYVQPVMQGVCCHCEFSLPYDATSGKEAETAERFVREGSEEMQRQGAYFSRPYGPWADMVYRRDAETTIALRKVKSVFDPNNIMNPGKLCF